MNDDIDPLEVYIGIRIQHLRAEQGLSRADLAAKAFTDKEEIKALETGSQPFTPRRLFLLARALNTLVDDLFPGMVC